MDGLLQVGGGGTPSWVLGVARGVGRCSVHRPFFVFVVVALWWCSCCVMLHGLYSVYGRLRRWHGHEWCFDCLCVVLEMKCIHSGVWNPRHPSIARVVLLVRCCTLVVGVCVCRWHHPLSCCFAWRAAAGVGTSALAPFASFRFASLRVVARECTSMVFNNIPSFSSLSSLSLWFPPFPCIPQPRFWLVSTSSLPFTSGTWR